MRASLFDAMTIAYCFNPNCLQPQNSGVNEFCQSCGTPLILQERYQAIRLLGKGNTGRTFLVCDRRQPASSQRYVLKQFRHEYLSESRRHPDSDWLLRLGEHPQIPKLQDYFEHEHYVYLVQDYVAGINLADYQMTQGRFQVEMVWQLLEELLPVLQFIHAHHIVHRDIKPENVILTPQQSFVLVDFASATIVPYETLEPWSATIGSPEYAAPEQVKGQVVCASDLYSLGTTCIHLLTGVSPFQLFDFVQNRWVWCDYWFPESASPSDRLHLAQFLDRLIEPTLSQRVASATTAITHLQTLRGRKPRTTTHPPHSSQWQCHTTLMGHDGLFAGVNAVAIAPDATLIASGSDDKTVRLWHIQTGKEQAILQGHTQPVKAVSFSPIAVPLLLASGSSDRTIRIWDVSQHQEMFQLAGHTGAVETLEFSPDGCWLASGSSDKTIKLWNVLTWDCVATLTGHLLAVKAIAFHPSQPLLASASGDATVRVWDWRSAQVVQTLTAHTRSVKAIAFTPDGTRLATGGEDNQICLWNTMSWQCTGILSGHPWVVSALTFSPDGSLLFSGSWDKTVKIWQVNQGQEQERLRGHTDSITSVAIASQGTLLATGSQDRTVRIWRN